MAMEISGHPIGAPFELACSRDEAGRMSFVSLIGVSMVLAVYTVYYAYIYSQKDLVGRPEDSDKSGAYLGSDCNPCSASRRRWFQPFCFLQNDSIDTPSDWLGDWISVGSSASDNERENQTAECQTPNHSDGVSLEFLRKWKGITNDD